MRRARALAKITSRGEEKSSNERKVLRAFLEKLGCAADDHRITSQLPPKPDLECSVSNGKVAFELTEICDSVLTSNASLLVRRDDKCQRALFTCDPSSLIVRKKLEKLYKTQFPIELLCYSNGRAISPDDCVCAAIQNEIEFADSIQFRRIWYWGEHGIYSASKSRYGLFEGGFVRFNGTLTLEL